MMIEVLEHTADVRLRITGPSIAALFRDALRGTTELLHPQRGAQVVRRDIVVNAADRTQLLIDFLNEALTQTLIHREAYDDVVFTSLTEGHAAAQLTGVNALAFGEDVKAVTYHEADIRRDANGVWSVIIVYDI